MITRDKHALVLAVSLAFLAGFVDALGFLELGGFFISFMSGNSTRFAVGIAEHGFFSSLTVIPLALICLFVLGVILGVFVQHLFVRRPTTQLLMFVALMLLLAALLNNIGMKFLAISCMVMAMGAENNALVREDHVTGVTYMTGTLVRLGQTLAAAILGKPSRDTIPFLLLWLSLVSGVIAGSFSYALFGLQSLWTAAAFAGFIAALTSRLKIAP